VCRLVLPSAVRYTESVIKTGEPIG
jgi:hypothetical protein